MRGIKTGPFSYAERHFDARPMKAGGSAEERRREGDGGVLCPLTRRHLLHAALLSFSPPLHRSSHNGPAEREKCHHSTLENRTRKRKRSSTGVCISIQNSSDKDLSTHTHKRICARPTPNCKNVQTYCRHIYIIPQLTKHIFNLTDCSH